MRHRAPPKLQQHGVSLIVVLLILVIVSLLGVASIQISRMATQSARNERDSQIAWQAAEAALLDAELDIVGKLAPSGSKRAAIFNNKSTDVQKFIKGCGIGSGTDSASAHSSGSNKGLCAAVENATPAWLNINFLTPSTGSPKYVNFGEFTGRFFQSGSTGIQPAHPPRYIIELIDDPNVERTKAVQYRKYIYRITAVGFGPNENTQVVLQTIFRN